MTTKVVKPFGPFLSCPFCGSQTVELCSTNQWAYWVRCAECRADADSAKNPKQATLNWNRRSPATYAQVEDEFEWRTDWKAHRRSDISRAECQMEGA